MSCNCYRASGFPDPNCSIHGSVKGRRPKSKGKGNPLLRTPLKQKSDKQKIRDAFLMGIKAERIRGMIEEFGEPKCEECGRVIASDIPYENVSIEVTVSEYIEACMELLDGHHIKPRDSGPPYKTWNNHGIDSPANITLLCRKCHRATEPSPQFGS